MIAPKLSKGDTIGVVSPATPVPPKDRQLEAGVKFLESLGFTVTLGKQVYSNTLGYSATPLEKAEDINTMFADRAVKAIMCSQGGDNANACLPYLDWEMIRANPKVFLGISDITVLLNALYTQTGLITFHGNDVMWGFGRQPSPYDVQEFIGCLVEGRIGRINANGERRTIRRGIGEGILLGGNLRGLLKLAGTSYFPDFSGAVLFIEGISITPAESDFMLHHLKQLGVLDKVQGVIIGYIDGLDSDPNVVARMQDVMLTVTSEYDFPILKVSDFGHNCPNTVMPVGGKVRVNADMQEIEILERCVQAVS